MREGHGGQKLCPRCDEPMVRASERDYRLQGLTRLHWVCTEPSCGLVDMTLAYPAVMRRSPAGNPAPAAA